MTKQKLLELQSSVYISLVFGMRHLLHGITRFLCFDILNTKSNFTDKIKNAVSQSHIHVYMFFQSYHLNELLIDKWAQDWSPQGSPFLPRIECFHMTSRRPYWCPKTMERRPCWCPKPILWELNSFLMQTLSFVPTICIDAGHVSENTLLTTHVLTFTRLYTLLFCRHVQFSN